MIISHKKKFIFVHVPKVAGSSLYWALEPYEMGLWEGMMTKGAKYMKHKGRRKFTFSQHTKAKKLKRLMSPKTYDNYYKFAFVRNPWDRETSWYKWILKTKKNPELTEEVARLKNFNDFILWFFDNKEKMNQVYEDQFNFCHDEDGNQIVDFIGRFENLTQDYQKILAHLKLDFKPLPTKNTTRKGNLTKSDFRSMYNDRSIELVAKMRAKDIETFGYTF